MIKENQEPLEPLICVEYEDGIFRWIGEEEAKELDKQDAAVLKLMWKLPKGAVIFYFSAFYLPLNIFTTAANAVVRGTNANSTCIEKVDSRYTSCIEDEETPFGHIYDYRPYSLKNKGKKGPIKGKGRILGGSNFTEKVLPKQKFLLPIVPVKEMASSSLFARPIAIPQTNVQTISRNVIKRTEIKFQKGDYLKEELKEALKERSVFIKTAREILKKENKIIISQELAKASSNLLKIRGGLTIPGLGFPFAKEILGWGIKNAQKIIAAEDKEKPISRQELLKVFDIRNPLVLVGLAVIGFTVFRGKKGEKKITKLIENIQEAVGLKKKNTMTGVASDSVVSIFKFFKKRPYLFILTVLFIWKRKLLYNLITNSTERSDLTSLAFNLLKKQTELIVEAKDKTVSITSEWMLKFFDKMKNFSDLDAKRMAKQELEIEKLREVAKETSNQIHNHVMNLQETTFNLQQCDSDHERTHKNNHILYEYYKNLKKSNQEFFKTVGTTSAQNLNESLPLVPNPTQQLALRAQEEALKKIEAQIAQDGAELLRDPERKTYAQQDTQRVTLNINFKQKEKKKT